jgi:membrane associated rhomboid family serine protease
MSSISFGGPLTPIVKRIIIACASVFWFAYCGSDRDYFSPRLVLASLLLAAFDLLFLRGGIFHLLFNMLALFMFGYEMGVLGAAFPSLLSSPASAPCVFLTPTTFVPHSES